MCKTAIEIELEKVFMEQNVEKEYIKNLKEKFCSYNKKLKRLILSKFMKHISDENSLALFDEDIFEIYKTIIDAYIVFLNKISNKQFNFNSEMQKNLSGIKSLLESQVGFFCENSNTDINPIYTEKRSIVTKYIDNIYKDIEKITENIDYNVEVEEAKEYFVNLAINIIMGSYKRNLIKCFNDVNDSENRKEVSNFKEVLEEEREILTSIIKLQVKALEDLCVTEKEKEDIEFLLKPIIEIYQQTGKSFDTLNDKFKTLYLNLDTDFESDKIAIQEAIYECFKDVSLPKNDMKKEVLNIVDKHLDDIKNGIIDEEKEEINNFNTYINNTFNLSENIKKIFSDITTYIKNQEAIYKTTEVYDIINGICESIDIKVDNIKEKEEELYNNKQQLLKSFDDVLEKIYNLQVEYDENEVYLSLKESVDIEKIKSLINVKPIFKELKKSYVNYIRSIDDFIKNTILFEISTFQEIIYYSVVRLRDNEKKEVNNLATYIDKKENYIEKELENMQIYAIKPLPHNMFNAKEHEVLLAEKNSDFTKGEIIKVINYGYKAKDKGVIKRATVIAAK